MNNQHDATSWWNIGYRDGMYCAGMFCGEIYCSEIYLEPKLHSNL